MGDIVEVANQIQTKIRQLALGRDIIKERAREKADAVGEYEKEIAKTLIGLKNGKEFTLEGETIKDPPASITEKIARGICYQEKINAELKEMEYKNAIIGMQSLESELMGYQSIFRHLEHEVENEKNY